MGKDYLVTPVIHSLQSYKLSHSFRITRSRPPRPSLRHNAMSTTSSLTLSCRACKQPSKVCTCAPTPCKKPQADKKRRHEQEEEPTKKARSNNPVELNPLQRYLVAHPLLFSRIGLMRHTLKWTPIFELLPDNGCEVYECCESDLAPVIPSKDVRNVIIRETFEMGRGYVACIVNDKRFHHEPVFGFFKTPALESFSSRAIEHFVKHVRQQAKIPAAVTSTTPTTPQTNSQWEEHVMKSIARLSDFNSDGVSFDQIIHELGPTPVIQEHEQIHQVVSAAERLRGTGKIVVVVLPNRLVLKLA